MPGSIRAARFCRRKGASDALHLPDREIPYEDIFYRASDTIVLGEPTRGPAQANLFVAGCRRTIDAASAFVRAQDTYRVTATPPPR